MKINWKKVCQSKGYNSLKAAYIHDVQKEWRSKAELLKKFYWVIGRAKHYAHHTGKDIDSVLGEWENERTYWWLNYYQDCNQPKIHTNSVKSYGIKGLRKYYKTSWHDSAQQLKNRICSFIQQQQEKASTKQKKRWSSEHKQRKKKYGF